MTPQRASLFTTVLKWKEVRFISTVEYVPNFIDRRDRYLIYVKDLLISYECRDQFVYMH